MLARKLNPQMNVPGPDQSLAPSSSGSHGQEAPSSLHGSVVDARDFNALDSWLATAPQAGGFAVIACEDELARCESIADHASRRFEAAAGRVLRISGLEGSEGFRELVRALTPDSTSLAVQTSRDTAACIIEQLASRADAQTAIVVTDREPSRFALAVAADLDAAWNARSAEGAPRALPPVVWVVGSSGVDRLAAALPAAHTSGQLFIVDRELEVGAARSWWEAARNQLTINEPARVELLEQWWRGASADLAAHLSQSDVSSEQVEQTLITDHAARMLALVGRAWPVDALERLGLTDADVTRLVSAGLADVRTHLAPVAGPPSSGRPSSRARMSVVLRAHVTLDQLEDLGALTIEGVRRAASALESRFDGDAWAMLRAAEVLLRGSASAVSHGEDASALLKDGDRLALAVLANTTDAEARVDFWSKLEAASPKPSPTAERLLPYVDLALRKGDGDWALKIARAAISVTTQPSLSVLVALGRALATSGDLTAASFTLEKVTEAASVAIEDRIVQARACVELAEARYYASDLNGARNAATNGLDRLQEILQVRSSTEDDRLIRLDARNVLGKLLLAQGDFRAAEHHFAADAFEASLAQQPVGELRAKVNRAIAVMSLGRRAEAQNLLEAVLLEGERTGELKAKGISLINLATLAIIDRRYGEALDLSDQAVEVLRRIGDKVALSRCIANLAELRARIGLIEEAAQAVRFGMRVLRGGLPPEQASRFALVLARVALSKGDTSGASRHVAQALAALGTTICLDQPRKAEGDVNAKGPVAEHVSEALRLAARIALEDGDTARAHVLIDRAAIERAPQRARAEINLLRAMLARALGEPHDELATAALRSAREADDDELLREAHVLSYRAALDVGATVLARQHLDTALVLRDRIAEGVPAQLRSAFLNRRDILDLDRELALLAPAITPEDAPVSQLARALGAVTAAQRFNAPFTGASSAGQPRRMVGEDPAILNLLRAIKKVGAADATILIHGESGTGKELVAEAVHEASTRRTGPLVKVNCAALVETLLLSELFGHEKGAFTGAAARRRGRFEAAEGGTLFLDEIGDISPRTQVALLRVLQEKTFERVGGTTPIRANVRVVCATHRNLKALVARGEFREDLYYRLCGVTLEVPALRSRLGDLSALCDAILRRISEERGGAVKTLSPSALSALKSHTWPGNVRELENGLRAASLFADGDMLEPQDFADNVESLRHISETVEALPPASMPSIPPSMPASRVSRVDISRPGADPASPDSMLGAASIAAPSSAGSQPPSATPSDIAYAHVRSGTSLHDMKRLIERECIVRALGDAGGNITKAAGLLGMKRPRLSQLVKQYGLGGGDLSDDGADACSVEEDE